MNSIRSNPPPFFSYPVLVLPRLLSGMFVLIALTAVALNAAALLAADKQPIPTYTDPTETDDDFALQGEYRGFEQPTTKRSVESAALQVIALGNGQFEAVKFRGGLPGEPLHERYRSMFRGVAQGDTVELQGDRYDATIYDGIATLARKDGHFAGTLRRVVRSSPTLGLAPPPGAIVLYDGSGTEMWKNAKVTPQGLLMPGTETRDAYGDFRLHGEFRLPYKPLGRGQDRGNSGFYLQSRYEVQVLDSFGLPGIENECGALYRIKRPDVNMCLPPLEWQTYDIDFSGPKFDVTGRKIGNMRITVWHNGVRIHSGASIPSKTGAGQPEGPQPLVTKLQDHGNPVVYQNIWLLDRSTGVAALPAPPVPEPTLQPPVAIRISGF